MKGRPVQSMDPFIHRWVTEMPEDLNHRVIERLEPAENGCLLWTGSKSSKLQYGTVLLPSKIRPPGPRRQYPVYVHRVMWIRKHGLIIPDTLVLDHDDPDVGCRTRHCANIEHVRCKTKADNTRLAVLVRDGKYESRRETPCP